MLNMLLPNTVPIDRPYIFFMADLSVTTSSGILVPIASANNPIIIWGTWVISPISTPLKTRILLPIIRPTRPAKVSKRFYSEICHF